MAGRWFGVAAVGLSFLATHNALSQTPNTVESIQPFRVEQTTKTEKLELQLVSLNSHVNAWYVLRLRDIRSGRMRTFNIENARAPQVRLQLDPATGQLDFFKGSAKVDSCPNFLDQIQDRAATAYPYSPLCNDRIYIRNRSNGYQPNIEKGTQLLRDYLGNVGEGIINAAKGTVFDGKYDERVKTVNDPAAQKGVEAKALKAAQISPSYKSQLMAQHKLDIALGTGFSVRAMVPGEWYPTANFSGVYVSLIAPGMVSTDILNSYKDRVRPLQDREVNSLAYLVAFNMKSYSMGWAHGTNHPGIGWSDRLSPEQVAAYGGGPGPDGVNSFGDLIVPGKVPPSDWARTVATFSGGFQLHHSHFERGPFSKVNKGSHYGFIEDGVIMAKPNVGLATIFVRIDGSLVMKTWAESDNAEIPRIRYLRQNGLPVIEPDASGNGVPGTFVGNRNEGNWSGSVQGDNYTPRGAACLIEREGEQFFVYGYFSAATPNAIARVFQAYGCKSAIHLDMNSPGQAYFSMVGISGGSVDAQHLMKDMMEVDPGRTMPRYFAVPDFRDFFWIVRKN